MLALRASSVLQALCHCQILIAAEHGNHEPPRPLIWNQKALFLNGLHTAFVFGVLAVSQASGQTCPCCLGRFEVSPIFVDPLIRNSDVISKKSLRREAVGEEAIHSQAAWRFDVISC